MNTQIIKEKIKTYSINIWELAKRRKILSSIIAIIIVITAGYFIFGSSDEQQYTTVVAKRGNVIREISATGRVKPAKSVDMAFERTGKTAHIYVDINDKVSAGQILASLYNEDLKAQLMQAQAGVESAQAKLDELKKGSRPEDIQIKKSELAKAQQDLDNYYSATIDVLNDSYTKSDDAVRKQLDALFSNDETNPQLSFTSSDSQAQIDSQWQRIIVGTALNDWKKELDNLKLNPSNTSIDTALKNSKQRLTTIRDFLSRVMNCVENAVGTTQTTIDTYKTNVNAARAEVNTAITNTNTQDQTISSQKITVQKIQDELNLKLAGSTAEQIAAQEAAVKEAQANVKNYEAQIEKTIIRSPFNGIVTRQDAKVGEITAQNTAIISVMSNAKFQVEADIPEVDIAKIKLNDPAKVTLDAYSSDVIFEAKVSEIEPAENIIEGVATYKVTFQFTKESDLIKSGMTANLDILTDTKENVIYIPMRTVKTNGEKTVQKLESDDVIKEVRVETGLRGSDGNVEITSGINEGDVIIVSIK